MKFADFQNVLSPERLTRYVEACENDTRKAMSLYRLNLSLSQEVFTLLSCFEVALRNAIDKELTFRLGKNWLRDSVSKGGIFDIVSCRDSARIIAKAYNRLSHNGEYSHHKLLAEMEFGIWKYMFANPQYRATGQILLRIFPNKPRSSAEIQYNNSYMFNELDGINILRNRIAHHEPICFARRQPQISTSYILNAYQNLHKLFQWMGIDSHSLLYGLDHVQRVCGRIMKLMP
ncbi:MAG: Abi family protein [Duncaniella sp.]|nr:Abi family protein [Duncaniella sp.]HBI59201.1 CAAX protease [Porphyromonadaceae bacterium]